MSCIEQFREPFYYDDAPREIDPVPKILRMPKQTERRNGGSSSPTQNSQSPAEVIHLPLKSDEEAASAAKVAKWLMLADTALGEAQTRKEA